ncbi:hypothetical protein A3765_13915 [Oleiphilus sp. HI0130]|nr:hypothetical protein A3765_13915 [Oleiphilus sp. HI0130]
MSNLILFATLGIFFLLVLYLLHFLWRVIRGEKSKDGQVGLGSLVFGLGLGAVAIFFYSQDKEPELRTTARQLYAEFDNNEFNAQAKYGGKDVVISGEIATSGASLGEPWIIFDVNSKLFGVQCFFSQSDAAKLSATKGQNIKVSGTVKRMTGSVIVENCKPI